MSITEVKIEIPETKLPPIIVAGRIASTISAPPPPSQERWVELGIYEHPASGETVSLCRSYIKEMVALVSMTGVSAAYQWGPDTWQDAIFVVGLVIGLMVAVVATTVEFCAKLIIDDPEPRTGCCFCMAQKCGYLPYNLVVRGRGRPKIKPRMTPRPKSCCWKCCGGEMYVAEI